MDVKDIYKITKWSPAVELKQEYKNSIIVLIILVVILFTTILYQLHYNKTHARTYIKPAKIKTSRFNNVNFKIKKFINSGGKL